MLNRIPVAARAGFENPKPHLISPCYIYYLCFLPANSQRVRAALDGSCLGQPLSGDAGGEVQMLLSGWSVGELLKFHQVYQE